MDLIFVLDLMASSGYFQKQSHDSLSMIMKVELILWTW